MRKISVCLVLLMMAVAVFGAESQDSKDVNMKCRTALVFDFNGLQLSDYEGGVGIKHWISKSTALVAGVQGYYGRQTNDDVNDKSGRHIRQTKIGLLAAFENHPGSWKKLSPFWGVSLGVGNDHDVWEYLPAENSGGQTDTYDDSSLYITPSVFFGAELFLLKNVSLSGKYMVGLTYSSGTSDFTSGPDKSEQKIKTTIIRANAASLTVAVYF